MTKFFVNADRFDPYMGFKFKIKWDGNYIAGLNKCGALKRTTEVATWYEAGDHSAPRMIPGKTKYDPIVLQQGIGALTVFEEWANKVNNYLGDAAMSLKTFRKDITIDVFNHQGNRVLSYNVFRCWISEYQALPELDAGGNSVMISTIKLENEGWIRDTSVVEPVET